MKTYIVVSFVFASAVISCNARVIDQVHLEDNAESLTDLGLDSFGGSLQHLSADQSNIVLSRQKRDWVQTLAFLQVLNNLGNYWGNLNRNNNNNQAAGRGNSNSNVGSVGGGYGTGQGSENGIQIDNQNFNG